MSNFDYKYADDFYLDNYKKFEGIVRERTEDLSVEIIKNGIFVPCDLPAPPKYGGVFTESGEYVETSAFHALYEVDSWGQGVCEKNNAEYIDEDVIYLGVFWKQWGHFLMDHISRLWYVIKENSSLKIVYCAEENIEISGVYLDFFKFLSIPQEHLIKISRPTKFRSIIVPECSYQPGKYYHACFKDIFDRVRNNALASVNASIRNKYKGKDIYFSRKYIGGRIPQDIGQIELDNLFYKAGYLIVCPEKYSLAEQIAMVYDSRKIACLQGTLAHNMMFAEDNANLIYIKKSYKYNYRQFDINHIRDLHVITIDAHISLNPVMADGPFIIDMNDNIRRYFYDYHEMEIPKLRYWLKRKMNFLIYIAVRFYKCLKRRGLYRGHIQIWVDGGIIEDDRHDKEMRRFYIKKLIL